jgi:hypothetical protein
MVMLAVVIKALFQEKKLTRGFLNREWHMPPRSQKTLKNLSRWHVLLGRPTTRPDILAKRLAYIKRRARIVSHFMI